MIKRQPSYSLERRIGNRDAGEGDNHYDDDDYDKDGDDTDGGDEDEDGDGLGEGGAKKRKKPSGHFRQKGRLTLEGTLKRSLSGKSLVTIDHRATPKQQKRRLGNVSWKIPKTKTKRLRGERGNFG